MKRWTLIPMLIAAGLTLSACDRASDAGAPAAGGASGDHGAREADSQEQAEADIDDLLALPYAGWVEEDEDVETGLVHIDRARSYPGYTLFSLYLLGAAMLVDHDGDVVHTWTAHVPSRWDRVNLLENGDLLLAGRGREKTSEKLLMRYALRMSWTGEVVWEQRIGAHHEVATSPDGRMLALTIELRDIPEISTKSGTIVRDNNISLLTEAGEITDSVSLYDAIAAKPDVFPLKDRRRGKRDKIDLLHCNSIEWMYQPELFDRHPLYGPDNVLVCSRHQDRIFVVDMKRRELVWAWGQDEISGPHDAQVLPNGNILLLDNGLSEKRSRAVEVDPLTGSIVWQYQAPNPRDFFTRTKGSVQRLPNGNTLIANADNGEIIEVTQGGDVVWRLISPARDEQGRRSTLHRARRYEPEFIEGLIARFGSNPELPTPTSRPAQP